MNSIERVVLLGGPGDKPVLQGVHVGDCVEYLNERSLSWADLAFVDPPFNIGYNYAGGYDDKRNADEYVAWSLAWINAVVRALKPNGSFYIAIGDRFAAEICCAAKSLGLNLRSWIVWHYTFGQATQKQFSKTHTHILYFTKSREAFTWNADAIRIPSARQTTYGDARAASKGKLPDDVWFLRPPEAIAYDDRYFSSCGDTWIESRVCGTFKERQGWHGCQMPLSILERIVKVSSNPGDVVLDCMCGSGTTLVAANNLGRRYVGVDSCAEYVEHARKRIAGGESRTDGGNVDALGRARVKRLRRSKPAKHC